MNVDNGQLIEILETETLISLGAEQAIPSSLGDETADSLLDEARELFEKLHRCEKQLRKHLGFKEKLTAQELRDLLDGKRLADLESIPSAEDEHLNNYLEDAQEALEDLNQTEQCLREALEDK